MHSDSDYIIIFYISLVIQISPLDIEPLNDICEGYWNRAEDRCFTALITKTEPWNIQVEVTVIAENADW